MKPIGLLGVFAVAALSLSQSRSGTYLAPGADPVAWYVNEHHTLMWGGAPYLPMGLRIEGSVEHVNRASAAGFRDVIVEMPASGMGWKPVLQRLDELDMRYLVAISSAAPPCTGIAVEPQSYRVTGITKKVHLERTIPGATSALVMLVTRIDGMVRKTLRVPTPNGKLSVDLDPISSLEHVALVYPSLTTLSQVDCWGGMDAHRDRLLLSLKTNLPGKGFRGILNPIGVTPRLRQTQSFVPTDTLFRLEFKTHLVEKYKNPQNVQRSWGIHAVETQNFDELARLIPLWAGARGVPQLLDPTNDKTFTVDTKIAAIWADIEAVLSRAESTRFRRLAAALRRVTDVPVVQEWLGWASPYESGVAALDGLGVATHGTSLSAIADTAGRAASSLYRWRESGWLIATSIDPGAAADAAQRLSPAIDDLASMGYRGWFVRSTDPAIVQSASAEVARRTSDAALAGWTPQALYFPESALNPANIMSLPGNRWWLPCPLDGNRVDLGRRLYGYRLAGAEPSFVLWCRDAPMRVKLLMSNPKDALFVAVDNTDPKPRLVKGGVEVDVGTLPLIVSGTSEVPIPEYSVKETSWQFDQLIREAEGLNIDTNEPRFLYINALDGLERSPAGNFAEMRSIVQKLALRVARYHLIEAEQVAETNFSEILPIPGTSGGTVLGLRTALSEGGPGYSAEYRVLPKTEQSLSVWIAARIPAAMRDSVRVNIGGQTLKIEDGPVGIYGPGFAWYRLGETKLPRGETRLVLQVSGGDGLDLAVDVILLTPGSFVPSGIDPPDPINYVPPPDKS